MKPIIHAMIILVVITPSTLLFGCSEATTTTPQLPRSTPTTAPPAVTASPLPSLTPAPICPATQTGLKFIPPKENENMGNSILTYLNAGGIPSEINASFAPDQPAPLDTLVVDLTGDGIHEIVVAGDLPPLPPDPGPTFEDSVYIFSCGNKMYTLEKEISLGHVVIDRTDTLLKGQPPQVIIDSLSMHGWASDYLVIGYMDGEYRIIFRESEIMPQLVVFDQDNDGNKEISIQSDTTATQGPIRKMISTFKWDGAKYSLVSNQLMPGTTLVEYLDDAQSALDKGDISMAIANYDRAAHDDTLGIFFSRREFTANQTKLARNYQTSFALFRLAVLWQSTGSVEVAESIIEELTEQFPENIPGYEFTQAANIFQEQIIKGATPHQACSEVTSFFGENYPDLNIHIGNWGMAVAEYSELIELCPFH